MNNILDEILAYSPKVEAKYKESIIEKFSQKQVEKGGDSRKFFNMYWQPFAWAAMLGFKNDRRTPLSGKTDPDIFKYSVINNQAPDILRALVVMAVGKLDDNENIEFQLKRLKKPDEIVNIINEYANGGFEIISRKLNEDPDYFYEHNKFITDLFEN